MAGQTEIRKSVCMWCHIHCLVEAKIRNGRLESVEENKDVPGADEIKAIVMACPRARAATEWLYHPDRLNYPLRRTGKRGGGKWEVIPREQALDEIAEKLKDIKDKYGAEAIATSTGTGRTHDEYRMRFFNLLGSPNNIGQGHVCYGPGSTVSRAVYGWPDFYPAAGRTTKCVMLLGANPEQGARGLWRSILTSIRGGAKLIVVDPRQTAAAARADIWLQLRPGTDCALYRAMITGEPYPVRAMLTAASNPLVTQPNTKLVYEALKSLDLYVVHDYWMTPSADIADYVLPAASWLERPGIFNYWDSNSFVYANEAAVSPVLDGEYDRRADYDLWRGLGIRLGQEEYWPWETFEDALSYRLEPFGYGPLPGFIKKTGGVVRPVKEERKYEKEGFGTPTGKVELSSTILEQLGYDPLPEYREPPQSPVSTPELSKEYPLILITGARHQPFYHSEHRQIASLRKQHPDPLVQVHPETAFRLGIGNGDWVWIETPRGKIKQKCQYYEGIDPGVVQAQHGWWFPELPGEEPSLHGVWESNINVVTDDDPDSCNPISGGWPLRALLCKIYKA